MPREVRYTGSFVTVGEDGTERTVHVFTEIIDVGTLKDPHAEAEGSPDCGGDMPSKSCYRRS